MEGSTLVSWGLIVVGWVVVHTFSCRRDRENKRKAFYASTRSLVEQIEEDAISYHTGETRNQDLEIKIKLCLQRLDGRLDLINGWQKEKQEIIPFRQIITASNFETAKFITHKHSDEIINSIVYQSNVLCEKLFSLELA